MVKQDGSREVDNYEVEQCEPNNNEDENPGVKCVVNPHSFIMRDSLIVDNFLDDFNLRIEVSQVQHETIPINTSGNDSTGEQSATKDEIQH